MSNSIKSYEERDAGLSPDHIRDYVQLVSEDLWQGVALDVGTGAGGWINRLQKSNKFSKLICTDLVDSRDQHMKDHDFFISDLAKETIPLKENSLDFVFAIEVIEHIENPRHFTREIFRVLKPKGKLVMSTPSCDSLRSKISMLIRGFFPAFCHSDYVGSGHITPITKNDYHRMLKEAGFSKNHDFYGMPGQIPSSRILWQSLIPFLKGSLWSDNYINIATK